MKAFAVLAKRTPFDAAKPASQKAILGAVQKVNEFLGALDTLELYSDWVPSRADPIVAVAFSTDTASASSKKNDDNAAGKVFVDEACWTSGSGKNHHWSAKFASRAAVCTVSVGLKKDSLPDKVEVQIDEASSGSKEEWKTVAEFKGKEVTERLTANVKGGSVTGRALKLVFTGLASENNNNCVVVTKVAAQALRPRETYSSSSEALSLLQGWFDSIATAAAGSEAAVDATEAAVGGLLHIARSTGSLNALLKAATHLLKGPQRPLSPSTAAVGARLIDALRGQIASERQAQNDAEYASFSTGGAGGSGGGGAAYGEVEGARFDPSGSSSGSLLTFSNDNATVYSSGYDNSYAVANVGPFSEGTASWTFKLDEDTTSQCSCFGAVIKPVSSANYEYSDSMYMYRAFNGHCYSKGSCTRYGSGDADKVKKGDTIRFDLDFNDGDGTIKATINGDNARGVVFSNLKGQEIWPACAFYSSGRQVTLVSVEASAAVAKASGLSVKAAGGAAKAAAAPAGGAAAGPSSAPSPITGCTLGLVSTLSLQDLPEEQVSVGKGALGKRGDLGFGDTPDDRKVKVGGKPMANAIAMHPPPAGTAAAAASTTTTGGAAASASASDSKSPDTEAVASDSKEGDAPAASAPSTAAASTESASETPDARKARILAACAAEGTSLFAHAASAVYWLGGGYERLTGSVALADSATSDLRSSSDASPLVFEAYGDGAKLLWRSAPLHAARSPALPFSVRVMGVQALRLVVRCTGGNAGAHAVWLDPQLTTATDWAAGGWRNDASTFTDGLTGAPRGGEAPVPLPHQTLPPLTAPGAAATPASSSAWLATSHGLASGLLVYTGLLAQEYTRGMRRPAPPSAGGDVAGIDTEAPFALEPSAGAVAAMDGLMAHLAGPGHAATGAAGAAALDTDRLAAACAGVVRTAAANLRRVVVAGVSPASLGLGTEKATATGSGKEKDKKASSSSPSPSVTLAGPVINAVTSLARLSLWAGKAAGHRVADGAPAATAGAGASASLPTVAASPVVQDAVWDFADLTRGLLALDENHAQARTGFLRSLCGKGEGGVVEVQSSWPCEEYDGDGALVAVETALLSAQLAAQAAGWRVRLLGAWPAKAWLVIEVPPATGSGEEATGGLADFVEGPLAEVFAQTDLGEWWAGGACDSLPLKLERSAGWDRRARLAFEPGIGAVRVYPGYVATFEEVVAGVQGLLIKH